MCSALTQLTKLTHSPEGAIKHACAVFNLRQKGWKGVEDMIEVKHLHARCFGLEEAIRAVSAHYNNYDCVEKVFRAASPEDQLELRGYILVKAALEYLSGRLSGPAAGSCDKMTAYIHIWLESPKWMTTAPSA